MIRVFALIPKRPDIGDERFHAHWRDPHGVLALRIATLRRYAQSHAVWPSVGGFEPSPYLGIAEVWFDSLEVAYGMGADPAYTQGAGADEPNFIDTARLAFVFTDDRVVRDGPAPGRDDHEVKALLLLTPRDGREGFADALTEAAARLAAGLPDLWRAAVCAALPETYGDAPPAYDAIVELSWRDRPAFERAWSSESAAGGLAALRELVAPEASASMLAQPDRLIWP